MKNKVLLSTLVAAALVSFAATANAASSTGTATVNATLEDRIEVSAPTVTGALIDPADGVLYLGTKGTDNNISLDFTVKSNDNFIASVPSTITMDRTGGSGSIQYPVSLTTTSYAAGNAVGVSPVVDGDAPTDYNFADDQAGAYVGNLVLTVTTAP